MNDKTNPFPVQIDIGAKAEAKFEVKAEVPPVSVGRFVDAITDIFRPFSEARGLRADQIRLQCAEVAIEIARLARQAIVEEGLEVRPIANKVLVPLIEKASNEDPADEFMIKRWVDLLVSVHKRKGYRRFMPKYCRRLTADRRRRCSVWQLTNIGTGIFPTQVLRIHFWK